MRAAMDSLVTSSGPVKKTPAAARPLFGNRMAGSVDALPKKQPRSLAIRYGTALSLVTLALLTTLLVQRFLVFPYPFLFLFFGAVMTSAWFGGMGAGLFAVLISTLAVDYFFVPPFYSWRISATAETYFVAFVVCDLVASWVSSSKKRSEESLQEVRDQLEIRVSERSAALMRPQAEWPHRSRALSMGELTASVAQEISQPLTAVVTNGNACLEWLAASPPNLLKARESAERIVHDGTRAGTVIARIRSLFKKEAPVKDWVNMNEVIQKLTVFFRHEATSCEVTSRTELTSTLPLVKADRVQLQQVMLNLIMNGMDAMSTTGPARELVIRSRKDGNDILIAVEDSGIGVDPEIADKVFDPFFTTKPHGIGMGLSISRSIIESHEGRLWATPNANGGTIFQFTLPIQAQDSDE